MMVFFFISIVKVPFQNIHWSSIKVGLLCFKHQGGDLVYVGGQKDIAYVDLDRLSGMGIVEVLQEISYVTNVEHVLFRVP